MKSLYFEKYGSSDVLSIRELPKPELKAGRVLVKVHAVSLNPLDWRLMQADPFVIRLIFGLCKPKHHCLGADFSGVVESVADDVSGFEVGDEVFGIMTPEITGTLSEYISIPASGLVPKPDSITHQKASTLGVAALTAYEGIHDYLTPIAGDRVLINGASGGIGTFAVQMARALGAQVTAVCSGRNEQLVRSIGAGAVVDYQSVDLLSIEERFDLIYDMIGNHPPKHMKQLLKEGGRLVLASGGEGMGFFKAMQIAKKDDSIDLIVDLKKDKTRLEAVLELSNTGRIEPVIDREYPFEEVADALDYVATKRARGKVVVNLVSKD
ncbi:MAG: NAD(P)-dependent alcohol dehydrogenase [Verrucomicrobiales bacterium]|nr:NAD(P)-dependent alcohol dehydrogenase [Verrucomicrobiales bacterium]